MVHVIHHIIQASFLIHLFHILRFLVHRLVEWSCVVLYQLRRRRRGRKKWKSRTRRLSLIKISSRKRSNVVHLPRCKCTTLTRLCLTFFLSFAASLTLSSFPLSVSHFFWAFCSSFHVHGFPIFGSISSLTFSLACK
jgi:hypothetical protein